MWYPPDPDEPTSEPYRLMPPRRPGDDDPVVLISPDLPRWRALDALKGHTSRALRRVDVWILIVGIAGVVIAYLAWVKPH